MRIAWVSHTFRLLLLGSLALAPRADATSHISQSTSDVETPTRFLFARQDALLYLGPAPRSGDVQVLRAGDRVTALERAEDGFWRVVFGDVEGFVHDSQLTSDAPRPGDADTEPAPQVFAADRDAVLYESPSSDSRVLREINEGEHVRVIERTEDEFWRVGVAEVEGFARASKLIPAYRMGNGLAPPRLLRRVDPSYTREAVQKEVEGTVVLEVVILPQGIIGPVRVLQPLPAGLTAQAIECVRKWRFVPARFRGEAVAIIAEIEVEFTLLDRPKAPHFP